MGVPTAAFVAEQLGLPGIGYEVTLNFTNKGRMRQVTQQAGLKAPPFRLIYNLDELEHAVSALGMPIIVKPVDSQSGKGVALVERMDGLIHAFHHALKHSREGAVLIETVVNGIEIIVDNFKLNEQTHVLGIARKTPNPLQPTVSARITYGHEFPDATLDRIKDVNHRTLSALGLRSGVVHGEYMLTGDEVIPIDIAARGGGCMIYTHVIPHVSGVDVNRAMIQLAMGESPSVLPAQRSTVNIEYFGMPKDVLAAIEGLDTSRGQPGVLGMHCDIAVGDRIGALSSNEAPPAISSPGGVRPRLPLLRQSLPRPVCG